MGDMFYLNLNVGNLSDVFSPVRLHAVTVHFVLKDINGKNQSRALNIVVMIQPRMAALNVYGSQQIIMSARAIFLEISKNYL